MATKDELKKAANELSRKGNEIYVQFLVKEHPDADKNGSAIKGYDLSREYQSWYSQCLPMVRTVLPDRFDEFVELYRTDPKRKNLDVGNYTIQDYFMGLSVTRHGEPMFDTGNVFRIRIESQLDILNSAIGSLESKLSDLGSVLQAQLFDSELEAAEDLRKKGHLRAVGAVAGVVLEHHLATVAAKHGLSFKKKAPTISDYNEALKDKGVVDVPMWRQIQVLADIRNICVHKKDREPTDSEVVDLIAGAKKVTGEVF